MSKQEQQNNLQKALETNLRLHPPKMAMGQVEMLSDALLSKFDDLEQRLNTYISGAANGNKLRKGMLSYISRLNANPLIPLHFRLKVLKRFEDQLDLFDDSMTTAILNAHKISIDILQKEALAEPGYYPILVDMIAHAIELAGRLMRDALAEYQSAAIMTVRQVFDLMRLGMVILPECSEGERQRFHIAVARYELLRNLDFFSLTTNEQAMVMDELQHHIQNLTPYYLAKGAPHVLEAQGCNLMVTNLNRPHEKAKILPAAPSSAASDYLLTPVDDFMDKLVASLNCAEQVLQNPLLQSQNLHVETALQTSIVGGNAILNAFRIQTRSHERQEYGNAQILIDWGLVDLITVVVEESLEQHGVVALGSEAAATPIVLQGSAWTVLNISQSGIAIERISSETESYEVGQMVGLHWTPHRGEPRFAFVRWIRYPRFGEQKIGLEFYMRNYEACRAVMLNIGNTSKHKQWPVLASFGQGHTHTMLFPDANISMGLVFFIQRGVEKDLFKVVKIVEQGSNYNLCTVQTAVELDM